MPDYYKLVCVDCGDTLMVGKLININQHGEVIHWSFNGWNECIGDISRPVDIDKLVFFFLILHRSHEIRLLSETCMDTCDPEGWLSGYDSSDELLSRSLLCDPDGELDCAIVPVDVKQRLKSLAESNEKRLEGDWDKPRRE